MIEYSILISVILLGMPLKDPVARAAYQKEYKKEYRQKNKEKILAMDKECYKKNKKKNHKKLTIKNWRCCGLVGDLDAIYERYINTTHCDTCKIELCSGNKGANHRCMDHCHVSGEFRNILCNTCNCQRQLKYKNNTSGHPNIKRHGGSWKFQKTINRKRYEVTIKSKIDCLCYKYIFILKLKAGLI